jgi:beta-N-acetylhexosaminidase
MNQEKHSTIESIISNMSIEQKVGQCLVIGYVGSVLTPDIKRRIRQYSPSGIRMGLTMRTKTAVHDPYATSEKCAHRVIRRPRGLVKDFLKGLPAPHCTNEEWCAMVNELKREALAHGPGTPLHITMDMEGGNSADYPRGGIHYFPMVMGLSESGDPTLAKEVAWAVARQVVALGFSWIHSPVLDVNTNPLNPEIGARSYNEDFAEAARYGAAALEGFREGGLITTGKHFPGRGASTQDAHGELPVIDLSEAELRQHLIPFQALIDAGVPSIMTAHTAYPSLDPSGRPATLSKPILTDLLKTEMGFQGAITTDDITMGGIVAEFEVFEACIETLKAGADLILFRDESNLLDEVFPKLVEAVKTGELPEERLNDALRRSLGVKFDYGLFEDGGLKPVEQAGDGIRDPRVAEIANNAARATTRILRDEAGLLPLKPSQKILLIEQVPPLHILTNDQTCHPGLLWDKLLTRSENVGMVECEMSFTEDDKARVRARLDEADILVMTNYYYRRGSCGNEFVQELVRLGKPVVIVTDSPYPVTVRPEYSTVVLSYGISPESMEAIADILFGASV